MADKKLLKIGVAGVAISSICCFTPVLVLTLSALGFSALIGGLDYVLLPVLGVSISLTVFALARKTPWRR